MIRTRTLATLFALGLSAFCLSAARAQAPKADCTKYKKLSDGRWTSTIEAKIGNPKSFIVLKPGIAIDRGLEIVGLNVSDTLDHLCGGK